MNKLFFLIFASLFSQTPVHATPQNGLGLELGVGFPDVTVNTPTQTARYGGVSVQGNLLFPLLSAGSFSMDLDLVYQYTSTENNASNSTLSEWAHFSGYGAGLRLNYSYLMVGAEYLTNQGRHIRAGTSNQIFEYQYNPIRWHVGLALPLSNVTSFVVGYSQTAESEINLASETLRVRQQTFWIRLQIDFGVSFFNLLNPEESFQSTGNGFFAQ